MTLCPIRLDIDRLTIGSPLPISADLIDQHARITTADQAALIDVYLGAAIEWAEAATHRSIIAREHRWVMRDFPQDDFQGIRLPRGKTQSVTGVVYKCGGSSTSLTGPSSGSPGGSDYQEDLRGDDGGLLMPLQGQSWPSVDLDVPDPVTITFTAGWLDAEIPAQLQHAILFAVDDAYDIRGTPDLAINGRNLMTREALVSSWRLVRWY